MNESYVPECDIQFNESYIFNIKIVENVFLLHFTNKKIKVDAVKAKTKPGVS